jgi:hypothetical protein
MLWANSPEVKLNIAMSIEDFVRLIALIIRSLIPPSGEKYTSVSAGQFRGGTGTERNNKDKEGYKNLLTRPPHGFMVAKGNNIHKKKLKKGMVFHKTPPQWGHFPFKGRN